MPKTYNVELGKLGKALAVADTIVLDFETTSLTPHCITIVGTGIYIPTLDQLHYINTGHTQTDPRVPGDHEADLVAALRPWLENPANHLIAHNATYDVRCLYALGIRPRCRVTCSMIVGHRCDENLRAFGPTQSWYYHLDKIGYGLKKLAVIYLNEEPPTLAEETDRKNPANAPPAKVARYCCLDCHNTWRLYEIFTKRMTPTVSELLHKIDDPNNHVIADMMWNGILIDADEIPRQRDLYEKSIQACRNKIWELTKTNWRHETKREIIKLLRHVDLPGQDHLDYDPFMLPPDGDEDELTLTGALLEQIFDHLMDYQDPEAQRKQQIVALLLSMNSMKQRIAAFLNPLSEHSRYSNDRLYPARFSSTLVTSRFSCSPNVQNLPGKADVTIDDTWREVIPEECRESQTTRNLFIARPGHQLVSIDLKAAEPRYLALHSQRALQDQGQTYKARVKDLYQRNFGRWPQLIQAMNQNSKPPTQRAFEVQWPPVQDDPLWRVFKHGIPTDDPYNALMMAMDPKSYHNAIASGDQQQIKLNRSRGKLSFLALGYGANPANLAPALKWSVAKTEQAITNIENTYITLNPLRQQTTLEFIKFGQVQSLYGRPRRVNGYFQLAQDEPVTIGFTRYRPVRRDYQAKIIPLGTTSPRLNADGELMGGGVIAFVEECWIELDDGRREIVLTGNPNGTVGHRSKSDVFVNADHFVQPPFRMIGFSQIQWVQDADGVYRKMPRQRRSARAAFNALAQATGADHLRWVMNRMHKLIQRYSVFADAKLVLSVHDSVIYEVPDEIVRQFKQAATRVISRRPSWSDIDFEVDVEVGRRFGEMK